MYKVRFHLGRGKYYMHWQVRGDDGSISYYDPRVVVLMMTRARLHNQRGRAQQIHNGGHKQVCGWVEAEGVTKFTYSEHWGACIADGEASGRMLSIGYNPRVLPHWFDANGNDIDGETGYILSQGRQLFLVRNSP